MQMPRHTGGGGGNKHIRASHARPNMGAWNSHMAILILGGHGHMGHQIVPLITLSHPIIHIGFGGSRMKTVATRAIYVYSRRVGAAWFQPLYGSGSHKY